VLFPLGLEARKALAYKVVKPSAFLFCTPGQREKIRNAMQKFGDERGCGLELLALRRAQGGRRSGSITEVAQRLYDYLRAGGDNLVKDFNLTRPSRKLDDLGQAHAQSLQVTKQLNHEALLDTIDIRRLPAPA
jgi:hypothetical protein